MVTFLDKMGDAVGSPAGRLVANATNLVSQPPVDAVAAAVVIVVACIALLGLLWAGLRMSD